MNIIHYYIIFNYIVFIKFYEKTEHFEVPIISYSKMCKKIQDIKYRDLTDSENQKYEKLWNLRFPKK